MSSDNEDKYYSPEDIQDVINELQDLLEDLILHEYDYMTEEGQRSIERMADLLNIEIEDE
jgi:hypothetical protein